MTSALSLRSELRAKREWALADQLRNQLKELGIVIEDHKEGSSWRKGSG